MHELDVPDNIPRIEEAQEMIRFWVQDGESYLHLNIGLFEPEDEASLWGSKLADIAKHAINGMTQDRPDIGDASSLLAEIEAGFYNRLKDYPEFSGQIRGVKH